MIHNPISIPNGSLTIYHPTSVSRENSGQRAVLSGVDTEPSGVVYFGSNNSQIALYVKDGNGNVVVNCYSASSINSRMTVTYQSETGTLTLSGSGTYYVFSTTQSDYYIF